MPDPDAFCFPTTDTEAQALAGPVGGQVLDLGPTALRPAGLAERDTQPGTFYGSGPPSPIAVETH